MDVGDPAALNEPVPPLRMDQAPEPTVGALAASVAEPAVMQRVWSVPAAAVVGTSSKVMTTSSVESAQVPLEMVQRRV